MQRGVLVLLAACGARSELDVERKPEAGAPEAAVVEAGSPCSPLTLVSNVTTSMMLVDGGYLYFSGDLGRVPTAGGTVNMYVHEYMTPGIDIAVDETFLYWTGLDGVVYRTNKDAVDSSLFSPIASVPNLQGIAVDASNIYVTGSSAWNMTDFAIWKFSKAGGGYPYGNPVLLVSVGTATAYQTHITVGADGLYATMGGVNGGILHTDIGGTVVETLALVDHPDALAADGTKVYLTAQGLFPGTMSVDKAGSTPPFYYTTMSSIRPTSIAVDDTTVYWTDGIRGSVDSAPKTQALVTNLVKGSFSAGFSPSVVAVDDLCLYYATSGPGAQIVRTTKH
jgi:hypothetical protein